MALQATKLSVIKEALQSQVGQHREYLSFLSGSPLALSAVKAYLSLGRNPNEFASSVINVRMKICRPKTCLLEQTFCLPCLQLPGLSIRVRITWLTRSGSDKGTSSTTRDGTTQQKRGRTPLRAVSIPWIWLFFLCFCYTQRGRNDEVGLPVLTCTSFPSVVQSVKLHFKVDGGVLRCF